MRSTDWPAATEADHAGGQELVAVGHGQRGELSGAEAGDDEVGQPPIVVTVPAARFSN